MDIKDYYAILKIPPHATTGEIKKAYRKMAMLYHPDKSGTDPEARQRFSQIQEAYETLSNPARKEAYLRERWLGKAMGQASFSDHPLTAPDILRNCLQLNRQIASMDIYRLDHSGLARRLADQLNDENIRLLKEYGDPELTAQVLRTLLDSCLVLTPATLPLVIERIVKLSNGNIEWQQQIEWTSRQVMKKKWSPWLRLAGAILVTILLCWLIYQAGRS